MLAHVHGAGCGGHVPRGDWWACRAHAMHVATSDQNKPPIPRGDKEK